MYLLSLMLMCGKVRVVCGVQKCALYPIKCVPNLRKKKRYVYDRRVVVPSY